MNSGEDSLAAAIREFKEETGFDPCPPYLPLGSIVQPAGKIVQAWAFEGTCDPSLLVSVETSTEWPPRSGRRIQVPEIDRAQFFRLEDARRAINVGQIPLLDRLLEQLG